MKGLKIFVLVLVFLISVLSGWVYMAGMGMERTILNNDYYRDILDQGEIFSGILGQGMQQMQKDMQDQSAEEHREAEMPEDIMDIISAAFSEAFHEDWFAEQFLLVVDDVLAMVKGEQDGVNAVIDLEEGKERFRDELIVQFGMLPDEKLRELNLSPGGIEYAADEIAGEMDLPDKFVIEDLLEDIINPPMEIIILNIQLYRDYFLFMPYLVFALLLIFSCLLAGFAGGLKWLGTAALISGLAFSGGVQIFRFAFIAPFIERFGEGIPVATETVSAFVTHTISILSVVPLVFTVAGLLLLMAGIVLGRKIKKEPV